MEISVRENVRPLKIQVQKIQEILDTTKRERSTNNTNRGMRRNPGTRYKNYFPQNHKENFTSQNKEVTTSVQEPHKTLNRL